MRQAIARAILSGLVERLLDQVPMNESSLQHILAVHELNLFHRALSVTATTEALQNFLDFGIPKAAMRPTVIASARVTLAEVLELHDDLLDDAIGFSLSDLLAEDWAAIQAGGEESWSQAVGRGCKLAGFEAMIVPSARRTGGKNIVVFPDNLQKDSTIEIDHKDLLPD